MQDPPTETPKLKRILGIIASNLAEEEIPFAAIGALALGIYGLPRHTSDLDLLTEVRFSDRVHGIMAHLGYTCIQKAEAFSQFDSEMGVLGRIDFMFVSTQDGKEMLVRCSRIEDDLWGSIRVVQPTDYVILKLMAIANDPERSGSDESDIAAVLRFCAANLLPDAFEPLQHDRLYRLSDRFGQRARIDKILQEVRRNQDRKDQFLL